jgi:nucleoside-diphosphate-sugar epimerase
MVFDDTNARRDWNWNPKYDMKNLVIKMLDELKRLKKAEKSGH